MNVNIIVATSLNKVIGFEGDIPWHIPADLKRFKKITRGSACIMGRKTFESLPDNARPLPDRTTFVISREPTYKAPGALVVQSIPDALGLCEGEFEDVFICGGSSIYSESFQFADRIYLTLVDQCVIGDTFFKHEITDDKWEKTSSEDHDGYSFITFIRRR